MNIFFLDKDPRMAAVMMCDKHVVKMVTESAQILSAVQRRLGNTDNSLYKEPGGNPKPAEWALKSRANYQWLIDHWVFLTLEYMKRYRKNIQSGAILMDTLGTGKVLPFSELYQVLDKSPYNCYLPDAGLTVPECSTKETILYSPADTWEKVIANYRYYYKKDKAYFARWEHGTPAPDWWTEGMSVDLVSKNEENI